MSELLVVVCVVFFYGSLPDGDDRENDHSCPLSILLLVNQQQTFKTKPAGQQRDILATIQGKLNTLKRDFTIQLKNLSSL